MSGREDSSLENDSAMLEQLAGLLDVHGSHQSRWPDGAAAALAPLLARSTAARRLLAEAAALDRLLAMAPGPTSGAAPLELTARIVREALREGGRDRPRVPSMGGLAQRQTAASSGLATWGAGRGIAAGVLAASVLVGAWLGTDSGTAPWIDRVLGTSGLEQTADADLFEDLNGMADGQGELL